MAERPKSSLKGSVPVEDPPRTAATADEPEKAGKKPSLSAQRRPTSLLTVPETRKERKETLASLVSSFHPAESSPDSVVPDPDTKTTKPKEMVALEAAGKEAEKSEKGYLDAVRAFNRTRGFAGVLAEGYVGPSSGPESLKEMRAAWIASRAAFAAAQRNATEARLAGRPKTREDVLEGLEKHKGKGSIDAEALKKRYERMVTVRSIVVGAEEKELAAKTEGLGSRERGAIEKLYERYKKIPPGARIMLTSALMFGVGALFGTSLSLMALGVGGGALGLRVAAQMQKNLAGRKTLGTLSRIASVAGLIGLASEGAVRNVHLGLDTEGNAQELLAKREGFGDLTDAKNLGKLSKKRRKALGAKETIERHGRLARLIGSLTGGFLFGHAHGAPHDAAVLTSDHGAADGLKVEVTDTAPPSGPSHADVPDTAPAGHAPEAAAQAPEQDSSAGDPYEARAQAAAADASNVPVPAEGAPAASVPGSEASPVELSSEDKIAEIYAYEKAHHGLPPGSDAHIEETVKHIEAGDLEPQHHEVLADSPEAAAPSLEPSPEIDPGVAPDMPAAPDTAMPGDASGPSPDPSPSEELLDRFKGQVAPEASSAGAVDAPASPDGLSTDQVNEAFKDYQPDAIHGVFENAHHIEIDPAVPAGYEWDVPDSSQEYLVAHGGEPAQYTDWAKDHATENPGSTVLYKTVTYDPITGAEELRMDGWRSDASGKVEQIFDVKDPDTGRSLAIPDPQDFISKIRR